MEASPLNVVPAVAIGRRIRSRRVELHLTGDQLCALTGIHRTRLSMIERGKCEPTGRQLRLLAKALDVTVDWLIADVVVELNSG